MSRNGNSWQAVTKGLRSEAALAGWWRLLAQKGIETRVVQDEKGLFVLERFGPDYFCGEHTPAGGPAAGNVKGG